MEKISKNKLWLKYINIPIEVLGNPELTNFQKILFSFIELLDGENGCSASNTYFANILNMSEITISNGINKLAKLKYIEKISFNGRKRIIKINTNYKIIHKEVFKNFNSRLKKNFKSDLKKSIDINNNSINNKESLLYKDSTSLLSKEEASDEASLDYLKNKKSHVKRKIPSFIEVQSKSIQSLFRFWNNLSPPLIKHNDNTKTAQRICVVLQKALNNNSEDEIKKAIKVYADILKDSNTIISRKALKIPGYKVGFDEFFGFSKRTRERMRLFNVDLNIKSWFEECLYENPKEKYGIYVDNKYPEVTNMFKKQWIEKKKQTNFSVDDENILRIAADKLVSFLKRNKNNFAFDISEIRYPQSAVHYVFEAIESKFYNWFDVTINFLSSDVMYNSQLPKYLTNLGMRKNEFYF